MYRQHVAPQTQHERTRLLIRGAKHRACARIAAFGVSALMAGQLLLPAAALATETSESAAAQDAASTAIAGPVEPGVVEQAASTSAAPAAPAALTAAEIEPAATLALAPTGEAAPAAALDAAGPAAAPITPAGEPAAEPAPMSEPAFASTPASTSAATPIARGANDVPGGGEITINTTFVNHFYDLELPPAFTLIQDEAFVYDFPDAPENFTLWRNESVHFFKIDLDTEALVKTENPEEANVSISLASIDNHERATLVFTGGGADPLISYSLNLFHLTHIGAFADFDFSNFNNGQGSILETRHEYFIRCVFGSNVYLIATDTTDPEPDPEVKPDSEVKPDPEVKPDVAPQPEAEKPAAEAASVSAAVVAKPADNTLPATGDNGALAVVLGAAGAAAAAAAGVGAARRRNR